MRVRVNHDLCEGNARCEQTAPDVFEVRDDDRAYVLVERPAEERRTDVETAVRLCPKAAIVLTED